jgi:hypothetical protein
MSARSDFYSAISNAGFNINKAPGSRLGVGIAGRKIQRKPRPLPGVNLANEKSVNDFLLRAFPNIKTNSKAQTKAVIWRETIRYYFQFGWSEKETAAQLRDDNDIGPNHRESVPYKRLTGGTIRTDFVPARIGGRYTMRKIRKRVGGQLVTVTSTAVRTPVRDIVRKIRRVARGVGRDGNDLKGQAVQNIDVVAGTAASAPKGSIL